MDVDDIDLKILGAFQRNGRISNKELAAEVGLSPSSCHTRVRKLRDAGVLGHTFAEVDAKTLGVGIQALISVQMGNHSREVTEAFLDAMAKLPETVAIYHLAGAYDFRIHVAVRDTDHLRDLGLDSLASLQEVRHIETALIFDYVRRPGLPVYAGAGESSTGMRGNGSQS